MGVEEEHEICAENSAMRRGRKHRRKGAPQERETRSARVKRGGRRPEERMSVEDECGLLLVQVVRMEVVAWKARSSWVERVIKCVRVVRLPKSKAETAVLETCSRKRASKCIRSVKGGEGGERGRPMSVPEDANERPRGRPERSQKTPMSIPEAALRNT